MRGADRFTDVPGLTVGHASIEHASTGTTVVLPTRPAVAGVDVRGGAPGTRDTDALRPSCLIERVHGFVLSGGSVFGLAAADGATCWLAGRGIGLHLALTVPVVPSAVIYDLANGGEKSWGSDPPYRQLGIAACQAAGTAGDVSGRVGAGRGAMAGSRPGGVGTASARTQDWVVGALIVVNSFGEVYEGEPPSGPVPLPKLPIAGTSTTIGIVATDAPLTKSQCQRLAMMAHDGLARSIRPIHSMFDGDTIFACSTAPSATPVTDLTLSVLGTLAADCTMRAVRRAIL